jgi:Protein of unknown function (DUF732)
MPTRRIPKATLAATIAAATLSVAMTFGYGSAQATPDEDAAFVAIVKQLNIPVPDPAQAIQVGQGVCTAMDSGKIEPAPTIRSVLSTLMSKGLDKGQSVGFLRGAIGIYCPQYTPLVAH